MRLPSRFFLIVTTERQKTMTKERYMALADFQDIWTNKIKPAIPGIAGTADYASDAICEAAADEIVFTLNQ